jgi:N-methylhydantoinase A
VSGERYVLGVDVGGTFTDLVLVRLSDGAAAFHKIASTPDDPSRAVIQGVTELLEIESVQPGAVQYFGHGTTVATNAVITGRTARTALITTKGFRDILEIRRQRQPHNYDIRINKPAPPVPRHLRREIAERVYLSGDAPRPPDLEELSAIVAELREQNVEAIAICFLHSYQKPEHEALVASVLRQHFPEAFTCASHEVLAEFREYERVSTTAINASLAPVMSRYLGRLEDQAKAMGLIAPRILQSNGGVASPRDAGALAVRTLASGPAAGVIGAAHLAVRAGLPDIITFDVGGTSTDICLIEQGRPAIAKHREFGGYPVRFPMIDVHSVGAGGGSIAWVDRGGFLHVGPQSAGADPGPACYDRGGREPTVTDANVVLGRLPPDALLGGRMPIRAELARRAVIERVAEPLGLSAEAAAYGILTILNENLIQAIRLISVERGFDPRKFTLVAFGGAGPLLASSLARELGIPSVLVPSNPGLLCAHGLLVADVRTDFSMTRIAALQEVGAEGLNAAFAELRQRADAWFAGEAIGADRQTIEFALDMRYVGQSHELTILVPDGVFASDDLPALVERFRREHERVYGYAPEGRLQVVTYRVTARAPIAGAPSIIAKPDASVAATAHIGSRGVYFQSSGGMVDCPIYDRAYLSPGAIIDGPAIIGQMDTTTVVLPDQTVRVDPNGMLMLTFRSA